MTFRFVLGGLPYNTQAHARSSLERDRVLDYHYGKLQAIVTEHFCKIISFDDHTMFVVLNNYAVKYIPDTAMDSQDGAEVMCFTSCGMFEEPIDVIAALYE